MTEHLDHTGGVVTAGDGPPSCCRHPYAPWANTPPGLLLPGQMAHASWGLGLDMCDGHLFGPWYVDPQTQGVSQGVMLWLPPEENGGE